MKLRIKKCIAFFLLITVMLPMCFPLYGSAVADYERINRRNIPADERTLRPLVKTFALLDGEDGSFRPDEPLTRSEAVLAVLPLYAVPEDVAGTYSTDFTDLKAGTALYDAVAFLERSEYLPIFGNSATFSPDEPMKKEELYQLLGEELTGGEASSTLTRGEAADILCRLIGKTAGGNTLVSFRDVPSNHPYADAIALAATVFPVKEVALSVAPGDDVAQRVTDAVKAAEDGVPTRITVDFADGTYVLADPITINGKAYDTQNLEIILKNATGAHPVLTDSVDISTSLFTPVEGTGYYQYALPESAKVRNRWPQFRNLYLDGQYLNMAASEEFVFDKSLRNTQNLGTSASWSYDNWFYLDPSYFEGVTNETVHPMEICINVEWMNKRFRVSEYHGTDSRWGLAQVSVMKTEWENFLNWDGNKRDFYGWVYWLENHISLLDEPGEFFYDDDNGIIYFYPYADTDMERGTISYPQSERLIDLPSGSGVTIEGFTFTGITSTLANAYGYNGGLGGIYLGNLTLIGDRGHIRSAAIYGSNTENVRVRNCTFHALGGHGIYLDFGNRNVTVKGNSFTDLAMAGIIMGRQYPDWTVTSGLRNIIVDNNYVHNVGIDYPLSPGIQITRVRSLAVTHNTVIHTPYCGIMVGWFMSPEKFFDHDMNSRQVEISYNHCEDNMYAINDGSGIYLPGANADIDTEDVLMRCHHNYIKATGYLKTYNGVYLDANASNWLVADNVIEGFQTTMGPIFNQGWYVPSQTSYNNYLLNNYTTQERVLVKEGGYLGHTVVHDKTVRSRNIVLEGNRYFETAAKLPAKAKSIISAAGQTAAYADTRYKRDTEVDMHVIDSHITLKKNGNPDQTYVTFTITNNDNRTASYKVVNTNALSLSRNGVATMVVRSVNGETGTRVLTLEPGETGTIEISFRGRSMAEAEGVAEFDVVKDDGWKMSFRRSLHITIGNETEETPVSAPDELLDDATDTLPTPERPTHPAETTGDPASTGEETEKDLGSLLPWGIGVGSVLVVAAVLIILYVCKRRKDAK